MATKKQIVEKEETKEEAKTNKTKKASTENSKKTSPKTKTSATSKTTGKKSTKKDSSEVKEKKVTKNSKGKTVKKTAQNAKKENISTTKKETEKIKNEEKIEKEEEVVNNKTSVKQPAHMDLSKGKKSKKNIEKEEKALTPSQMEEMEEVARKELRGNKRIPPEEQQSLYKKLFQNIGLAVTIMLYFNFIILGFINIENTIFITDIKVFGMATLIISIILFEIAYKKESGRYAIHGIEILALALVTISLIYVNLMWTNKFIAIVVLITYIFSIYYIVKSIIIYSKIKKQYLAKSIKEIIKK